uniref:DUF4283 domain-containing protein n=1 Tax=Aegilops tauschii subsp. strangulata TaxID=200361 RepID=A0A452Z7I7_AEGTS
HHRVASCCNPPTYLLCSRSGHTSHSCKKVRDSAAPSLPPLPPPSPPPLPQSPPPPSPPAAQQTTTAATKMAAPAADARCRPTMVTASIPWKPARAAAESDFERHAVIATVLGNRPEFTVHDVSMAASLQFGLPRTQMHVSLFSPGDFLIRFSDPRFKSKALRNPALLWIGGATLRLTAWSRRAGASVVRLSYKVRVCLEGAPRHAWSIPDVKELLPPTAIVESIDEEVYTDQESDCCCAWAWVDDVSKIATRGRLWVEEPCNPSSLDFHRQFMVGTPAVRRHFAPVSLLDYPIIIHLDWVHDHFVRPASPDSNKSISSGFSGILPSPLDDGVVKWRYNWHRKFVDSTFPPRTPRVSAHSRLNFGGGGDRDGPAGGHGGNGGGRWGGESSGRQQPPSAGGYGHSSGASGNGGEGGAHGGRRHHDGLAPSGGATLAVSGGHGSSSHGDCSSPSGMATTNGVVGLVGGPPSSGLATGALHASVAVGMPAGEYWASDPNRSELGSEPVSLLVSPAMVALVPTPMLVHEDKLVGQDTAPAAPASPAPALTVCADDNLTSLLHMGEDPSGISLGLGASSEPLVHLDAPSAQDCEALLGRDAAATNHSGLLPGLDELVVGFTGHLQPATTRTRQEEQLDHFIATFTCPTTPPLMTTPTHPTPPPLAILPSSPPTVAPPHQMATNDSRRASRPSPRMAWPPLTRSRSSS